MPKLLLSCVVLMALVWAIKLRFTWQVVSGTSMEPTFTSGDLIIIDKSAYRNSIPDREDVVVAVYNHEYILKRVVGLPGEEVEVIKGNLYLNGSLFRENHSVTVGGMTVGKGKLLPDKFATLGDNRSISPLLAVHPIVTREQILGKIVGVIRLPRHAASASEEQPQS